MEHRRPSLIGPLLLITIGVLFLLANAGMLPFSFWEITSRYWPLVLVLGGLDIIFGRRSALGALVILVLWIVLVGGVLWLAYNQGDGILPTAAGTSEEIVQPLQDVKSAFIRLNQGFSHAEINALDSDSGDLVKGTFTHSEGTRLNKTYQVAGSEARLGLSEEGVNFMLGGMSTSRWMLGLNPEIPIALEVDAGVGRAVLDLSGLNVTSLNLDTGIGSLIVTTPKEGVVNFRLNGGVGHANVTIPPGMAATIRVNAGLGGIRVDETRFPKFGNAYQSVDYATATNKIALDVDGGIGRVTIR